LAEKSKSIVLLPHPDDFYYLCILLQIEQETFSDDEFCGRTPLAGHGS
jgi:hypothetical protein